MEDFKKLSKEEQDKLIKKLWYDLSHNVAYIQQVTGLSEHYLSPRVKALGLPNRNKIIFENFRKEREKIKKELISDYEKTGEKPTLDDVCKKYDIKEGNAKKIFSDIGFGIKQKNRERQLNDKEKDTIKNLVAEGKSITFIARKLELRIKKVEKFLTENNLKLSESAVQLNRYVFQRILEINAIRGYDAVLKETPYPISMVNDVLGKTELDSNSEQHQKIKKICADGKKIELKKRESATCLIATKALLELKKDGCKWPVGNPREEDFHFCNKPRIDGKSYCEEHYKKAYLPAKKKPANESIPIDFVDRRRKRPPVGMK
jgi:hypothetical protein